MSDEKRAETGGAEAADDETAGRTFTEEQSAIFSNPHGTPAAARPRTPGAESAAPEAAGARPLGGGGDGEADFNESRPRRP